MGRRLRMSAEIGDWLTDLALIRPCRGAAGRRGASVALLDADNVPGLAFVTDLGTPAPVEPGDRVAAVDVAYQDLQSALRLQLLRQQSAEAGSFRTTSRQRISPAGSRPLPCARTRRSRKPVSARREGDRAQPPRGGSETLTPSGPGTKRSRCSYDGPAAAGTSSGRSLRPDRPSAAAATWARQPDAAEARQRRG